MRYFDSYDVYIFDCDGVVLDTNQLKIKAMDSSLIELGFSTTQVKQCVKYFSNNFGKSRFHHVDFFLENFLEANPKDKTVIKEKILNTFSDKCRSLYLKADITPGFIDFISSLQGYKYIASGSEQSELRQVFKSRGLATYFTNIFGSPIRKNELVSNILSIEPNQSVVMIGDAISDLEAAKSNSIDFIGYKPFSNVKKLLTDRCIIEDYPIISSWHEVKNYK